MRQPKPRIKTILSDALPTQALIERNKFLFQYQDFLGNQLNQGAQERSKTERALNGLERVKLDLLKGLAQAKSLHLKFQASKIPIAFLKGPVLSKELYGNWTSRQFLDLDILLIHPRQIRSAHEALVDLGYSCIHDAYPDNLPLFTKVDNHLVYTHPKHPFPIEVHTQLSKPRLFHFKAHSNKKLFVHQAYLASPFGEIPEIKKSVLGNYLLAHGHQHYWSSLHWLYDAFRFFSLNPLPTNPKYKRSVQVFNDLSTHYFIVGQGSSELLEHSRAGNTTWIKKPKKS